MTFFLLWNSKDILKNMGVFLSIQLEITWSNVVSIQLKSVWFNIVLDPFDSLYGQKQLQHCKCLLLFLQLKESYTGFELHKGESKRWQKSYLWETNQIQIIFLVLNNPWKSVIFQNIHPENQRTFPHGLSVFNTAGNKKSQTMEIQVSSSPRLRHLREKDYQIQQSCYTKASALRPYNCLVLLTIGAWHECLRIKRKHLRLKYHMPACGVKLERQQS